MKKLLLGGFVAATFVIYSLNQRHEGSAAVAIGPRLTTAPSSTPSASVASTSSPMGMSHMGFKDGQYTGSAANAVYGYIQVRITIQRGMLTDVVFVEYPNDRRNSIEINQQAMPLLKQEAIQAQSSRVDGVSGATDTSDAFVRSLSSALAKAS